MKGLELIVAIIAMVTGAGIGYYMRKLVSKAERSSVDLDIKEMLVSARSEAQKITDEAKKKYEEKIEEVKTEEKNKESYYKQTEHRLIKKEELLDARQTEIEKEIENIKIKIEDIKKTKDRVDDMENKKQGELEKIANMSAVDAKNELIKKMF